MNEMNLKVDKYLSNIKLLRDNSVFIRLSKPCGIPPFFDLLEILHCNKNKFP